MYLLLAIYGGLVSRWHGSGFDTFNPKIQNPLFKKLLKPLLLLINRSRKSIRNVFWALPFGLATYTVLSQSDITVLWLLLALSVLSFTSCLAGKGSGHGRIWNPYLPLDKSVEPEELEQNIVMEFISKKLSSYWYKVIALGVSGFLAVSGAALIIGTINPVYGLIIASGGVFGKIIGYLIGWKIPNIENGNEFGEIFTGVLSYLGLAIVLILSS